MKICICTPPVSQSRQPTFGENPLFENKTLLREAGCVTTCSALPFWTGYTQGKDELVSFQIQHIILCLRSFACKKPREEIFESVNFPNTCTSELLLCARKAVLILRLLYNWVGENCNVMHLRPCAIAPVFPTAAVGHRSHFNDRTAIIFMS